MQQLEILKKVKIVFLKLERKREKTDIYKDVIYNLAYFLS